MNANYRQLALAVGACLALAGCTQQDTDCLARMGRKFTERGQETATVLRTRLDGDLKVLPHAPPAATEAGLKEKIEARLRWDALLGDAKIEVHVTGTEVELKGTVKNDAQRRRAGDLAETTAGVVTVNDALKTEE